MEIESPVIPMRDFYFCKEYLHQQKQMKPTITFLFVLFLFGLHAQDLKEIAYSDGNQQLLGLCTSNSGQNVPGVLILPAWKGIDQEAKTAAYELQKQGYVVFIADIYGVGNTPSDNSSAAQIATQYKQDYKAYQRRISLALEQLKKAGADSAKLAVIGYCFGGTGTLEVARSGMSVNGIVCIHGGLAKASDRQNVPLTTKMLIEHPAEDKTVSNEDLEKFQTELREGKADWQLITYAGCGHTFTNPESQEYNPVMAERAWNHTLLFLQEVFR